MKKNILISIIVPAYNVEKYIENCIDSLISQTYKNIEIILVDDGSNDKTGDICKKKALLDKRIRYFYKENGGVADSRNYGLKMCKGDYLTFVDSDDLVDPKYVEILYSAIIENKSDISVCAFKKIYSEINFEENNEVNVIGIYNTRDALSHFLLQDTIDSSFWGKLYDKKLFKDIIINNYKVFEDMDTMYKLIAKSTNVTCISNVLYYYFVRNNSLIHAKFSEHNAKVIDIIDEMYNFIYPLYPELKAELLIRKINAYFYILRNVKKGTHYYNVSKQFIEENRKEVLKYKNAPVKTKAGIYISYISFSLIRPLFNFYGRLR